MAFFPFIPLPAMRARLLTDAPLVTAVQGVWAGAVPSNITLGDGLRPIVLIAQVNGVFDSSTFGSNIADAEYQVSVYDHRSNGTDAMQTAIERVWGDAEGTDNAPTYGLNRWTIAAPGIENAFVEPGTYGVLDDAETLHHFLTFRVRVTEA